MNMEIDIGRKDYYGRDAAINKRTKNRLIQLKEIGLKDLALATFGIKDVVSGLYIEKVWCQTIDEWNGTIKWLKQLIDQPKIYSKDDINDLVESLKDCLEWMESLRASGDAGHWEWDNDDVYTKAIKIFNKFKK